MLSTVQKAKAINEYLYKHKMRKHVDKTISDYIPVIVKSASEMKKVSFDMLEYYDVNVNFRGVPGVMMLVDIIDIDEQITANYDKYIGGK